MPSPVANYDGSIRKYTGVDKRVHLLPPFDRPRLLDFEMHPPKLSTQAISE